MDQSTITSATALRVPSDLVTWLSERPSLEAAWESCDDPEWLVALARIADVSVQEILRALAVCFPASPLPAGCPPDIVRTETALSELLAGYAAGGPPEVTEQDFKTVVMPMLQDMNSGRQYERHGPIEGIPRPPAHELRPFLNWANAVSRLHQQSTDHFRWPWPGRLTLVVGWLAQNAAMDRHWLLPLTQEQLSELSQREPASRAKLAARLRALIGLPRA